MPHLHQPEAWSKALKTQITINAPPLLSMTASKLELPQAESIPQHKKSKGHQDAARMDTPESNL